MNGEGSLTFNIKGGLYDMSRRRAKECHLKTSAYGGTAVKLMEIATSHGFSRARTRLLIDQQSVVLPKLSEPLANPREATHLWSYRMPFLMTDAEDALFRQHAEQTKPAPIEAYQRATRALRLLYVVTENFRSGKATFIHDSQPIQITNLPAICPDAERLNKLRTDITTDWCGHAISGEVAELIVIE